MQVTYTLRISLPMVHTEGTSIAELRKLLASETSIMLARELGQLQSARVDFMLPGGYGGHAEVQIAE